ncbi:Glycosyltransferase involved in cell wall bisynthesis [Flavobacterium segetis]|uniref:Glycosyltransferase involved in cell wall bisynthesis n=1 Tax=Flavobacterium segetis TaxID=271157 RepID=A0A1M5GTI6_9FLAO|nr:glycosyltransferase family 2 protein [Flavobacterium segetis]SHG06975.1 Glycosyltransferase involved in cell wall bisynthesis [Flavobacterium segetis]
MLAIVIPYYKIRFFEATLQSLADQKDKRFKVYIGNDASKDNPAALLEKYQNQFDFDYQYYNNNLGSIYLTQQWERCLTQVQEEEWVMFLCDDDVLDSNCVTSFYKNLDEIIKNKVNVIRYATVVIDQNNLPLSDVYKHPELERSTDFLMRKFKGGTRSSLSEFIFKTSVLKEVQFKNFPLAWYSDILAVVEVSNFELLYTINEVVVYFRLSGDNITSKTDNLVLKNVGTFGFYHYLLKEKSAFFNESEIAVLKQKLEKTFLDNKKNIRFWRLFTILYFSQLYIKSYFLFICKAMKMVVKKIK